MALADLAAYKARCDAPSDVRNLQKINVNLSAGQWLSMWTIAPNGGVAPTTPAVPARTIAGAIGQQDPSSERRLIHAGMLPGDQTSNPAGGAVRLILADRLSHQGGLSGTAVGEQTTNLPTAALTRYTSGVGVYAALEIYASIGTGGATATIRYTNDQGVGGQVSPELNFGVAGHNGVSSIRVVPLVQGDRGVRSVEGVTLSGSTGSAGNFGVTLFRPLVTLPLHHGMTPELYFAELLCNLPKIEADACLWLMLEGATASGAIGGDWSAELTFCEV